MKPLADIPNEAGFRVLLLRADTTSLPCIIGDRGDGSFCAISLHTRKPVVDSEPWGNFVGWQDIPKHPLEIHAESLPPFPDLRRAFLMGKTADQVRSHLAGQPLPKRNEAVIVANLGTIERITYTPAKSPEGKRLYLLERWQRI